jgi:hypothetical protein
MQFRRILAAALIAALAGAAAAAQSLGDVAKKEEERRKAIPTPAKVYTNKDLGTPGVPSPPPPAPAAAAPSAKAAEKKDAKPADAEKEPVKDQAYWAGRKKALDDAIDRNQTFADALQSRINALSADFVNRDDPAQRAQITLDRQKAIAELGRLKAQIESDKKALADLMEEARRAGVPPGWLR